MAPAGIRRGWNPVLLDVFAAVGVPFWVAEAAEEIRAWRPVVPVDAEEVMFPLTWLVRRIAPGTALTRAGHLPTAVVSDAVEAGLADPVGPARRESDLPQLGALRRAATSLGLVRPETGSLRVTELGRRLAEDPQALWWHLADTLPLDTEGFARHQAGLELLSLLLPVEAFELDPEDAIDEGLAAWHALGRRLDEALGSCWRDSAGRRARHGQTETGRLIGVLGLAGPGPHARTRPMPERAAAVAFARAALTREAQPLPEHRDPGPVDAVEILVTLRGTEPPVWRRVVVPADLTLDRLHLVIQGAMGWTDSHLHVFRCRGRLFGPDGLDIDEDTWDEATLSISQAAEVGCTLGYQYDFGDDWSHDLEVVRALPGYDLPTPHVLAGERACPPEDSGGVPGHADLCAALADPEAAGMSRERAADLRDQAPDGYDPERFDPAEADHRIAIMLSGDALARLQVAVERR
jgi:hypothetical protein